MKLILGGKGVGKTRRLVEIAHKTGATIVCRNKIDILNMAREMNLPEPDTMSYVGFVSNRNGGRNLDLLIDDVDGLLQWMAGDRAKVFAATFGTCYNTVETVTWDSRLTPKVVAEVEEMYKNCDVTVRINADGTWTPLEIIGRSGLDVDSPKRTTIKVAR